MINLINSVRTLMRSTIPPLPTSLCVSSGLMLEIETVPLIFLNVLIIVWAVAFG